MPASSSKVLRYDCPCRWFSRVKMASRWNPDFCNHTFLSTKAQLRGKTQLFTTMYLQPISINGMGLLPDTKTNAGCAGAGNVFSRHCFFRHQRKPLVSDPDMLHSTCVTHVPWCMSWSLTRGKRHRHSRRMRNPQFYVSDKRPMTSIFQQSFS